MHAKDQLEQIEKPLSLEREFILLNIRNIKRYPIPVLIILSSIAVFAYDYVPGNIVLVWFSLCVMVLLTRAYVIYKLPSFIGLSDKNKINIIVGLNIANGLIVFFSLYFIFFVPELERAFHTLFVAILAVGTTANNVGYKKAYLPYLFLTIVPLSIALMLYPASPNDQWKYYMLGAQGFLFSGIIYTMGSDSFKLFKGSIDLRSRYAEANIRLESALADSKSSNSAKTRFLASASHDLRQPVHTLSLFTAALRSRSLDQKTTDIVNAMDRSVLILNKQLEALLDMSKLDAGMVKPNMKSVNAASIVARQIEQFEPIAAKQGLALSFSLPQDANVHTDAILFERICNNLIGNAVKYTNQGKISIGLNVCGDHLNISIEDTGIGIDQSELNNIFEEFYQVNNPHRDKSEGLGLGLSIVRRLTQLLDINMTMTSKVGVGTVVRLQLPLSSCAENRELDRNSQTLLLDNLYVLVVDDEDDVLLASQSYLEALGCKPLLARSEDEAIELAQDNSIDLLITDLRLKDKASGIDVITALRNIHPNLPAIIISGDTAPDRLKEASAANASFLHKPIEGEVLKLAMLEAIGSKVTA